MKKKTVIGAAFAAGAAAALGLTTYATANHLLEIAIRRDGKLSDITGGRNVMGKGWEHFHDTVRLKHQQTEQTLVSSSLHFFPCLLFKVFFLPCIYIISKILIFVNFLVDSQKYE